MTFPSTLRKVRREKMNSFPGALTESEMIADLSEAVSSDQRPLKVLARAVDAVPRTVQNLRDGLHLPSSRTLVNLARACPAVKAKLLAWVNAEANHDADTELLAIQALRAATEFLEQRQRRLEKSL